MKRSIALRSLLALSLLGVVMFPNPAGAQKGHLGVICASDADCAPGLVCSGLPGTAVCVQTTQAGTEGSIPEKPVAELPPGNFGGPYLFDPTYAEKHPSLPPGAAPQYRTVPQGYVQSGPNSPPAQ